MSDEAGMNAGADEWVILKRYDDGLEAEIARNFLREHGIHASLQGNSGASSILNRFDTVIDIRLVVPEGELEHAREAMAALTPNPEDLVHEPPVSGDMAGSPYRASHARPHELTPDDDDAPAVKRRYRRAAFMLAFAMPIGSGHFYARHNVAGAVLGFGIAGYFVAGLTRGDLALVMAAVALVVFDSLLGVVAVRRFNEGRPFSPRQQVGIAAVGLVAAMGAGIFTAGYVLPDARDAHDANDAPETLKRAGVPGVR